MKDLFSEKRIFAEQWEQEFQLLIKGFKAYVSNDGNSRDDLLPIKELMASLLQHESMIDAAAHGRVDAQDHLQVSDASAETIDALETLHFNTSASVKGLTDEWFKEDVQVQVGQGYRTVRIGTFLSLLLTDYAYYRGQLSVHLRSPDFTADCEIYDAPLNLARDM